MGDAPFARASSEKFYPCPRSEVLPMYPVRTALMGSSRLPPGCAFERPLPTGVADSSAVAARARLIAAHACAVAVHALFVAAHAWFVAPHAWFATVHASFAAV